MVANTYIPKDLQALPAPVQMAWVREFERVIETSGNAVHAIEAADQIAAAFQSRQTSHVETVNRSVVLEATITEFAVANAGEYVPEAIMSEIRKQDPHPYLAVFEVGTEGISRGEGIRKVWSFAAIKELAKAAQVRIGKIFYQHGPTDNSHEGRQSLGEIIHGFYKRVNGAMKAYAVGWIQDKTTRDKIDSGEYDICSIEANVDLERQGEGNWFVQGVKKLTGLALASSAQATPGFAGASVEAVIRELADEGKGMGDSNSSGRVFYTVPETKVAVQMLNLKPSDLFGSDDILACDCVKKATEKAVADAIAPVQKEKEKLEKEMAPLKAEQTKAAVADMVKKSPLLTNAPQKQIDYLTEQLQRNGEILAASGDKLKNLVDSQLQVNLDMVKRLGIEFKADGNNGAGNNGQGQQQTDQQNANGGAGTDNGQQTTMNNGAAAGTFQHFANPANNPLLAKSAS